VKTSRTFRLNLFILVSLSLSGCSDDIERRVGRFKTFMSIDNFLRSSEQSKSVWIVKHSWAGKIYMGSFFGFIDNLHSCTEFVEPYNERYPEVYYTCEEI
jgi:hypothetical protein